MTMDAGIVLAGGPLRVHPANKRYFVDDSGKAIYLTGSHNWDTFQRWFEGMRHEQLTAVMPASFADYLNMLQGHHHNFIRLWVADTAWSPITRSPIEPQPYVRTGPGNTADGGLKFDLNRLNQDYFDALRTRVIAARDRGMYVAVMLFNGWGISVYREPVHDLTWDYHPFNKANNVNGVDGDADGDRRGLEFHGLHNPAITALQEAYVRKVVDTVNDLDNVLYEISNESDVTSVPWQYHLTRQIKDYEAAKPKQHPVIMSWGWGISHADLWASPADAVAPDGDGDDPPAATGGKVVILDSDHNGSTRSDPQFAWKAFLRGSQPIVMDWWSGSQWDPIRQALGQTRAYADSLNLAAMTPHDELASTRYCLADPGTEYLVYLPSGGTVTVDLTAAKSRLAVAWFQPAAGQHTNHGTVSGGGPRDFVAPFQGHAVLHLTCETRLNRKAL